MAAPGMRATIWSWLTRCGDCCCDDAAARAFDRRQSDRQESQYQAACQREPQLDVGNCDLGANQLIELAAPGSRTRSRSRGALVVAERAGRVAANQLRAAEENREPVGVL